MFRCFVIKKTQFYVELYRTIVIPKLMYSASVWRPHQRYLLNWTFLKLALRKSFGG